ncbi:hypothetical protein RND71_008156 [Anisodus tanguticus]|uniref:Uncharacterized protein n=1 Tax=Anisodus tanguticus TaxID=243964 RepID=A0AAE1VKR9_9SOLA|nr:hypothetical protein RND71_008156 [Anisodus tanguticus]
MGDEPVSSKVLNLPNKIKQIIRICIHPRFIPCDLNVVLVHKPGYGFDRLVGSSKKKIKDKLRKLLGYEESAHDVKRNIKTAVENAWEKSVIGVRQILNGG